MPTTVPTAVSTINNAAHYAAAFPEICGCFSSNAMVSSWASSTLSQTPEKRASATAIINRLSQLDNTWRLCFFPDGNETRYIMANLQMMSLSLLFVGTGVIMKVMLTKANRRNGCLTSNVTEALWPSLTLRIADNYLYGRSNILYIVKK